MRSELPTKSARLVISLSRSRSSTFWKPSKRCAPREERFWLFALAAMTRRFDPHFRVDSRSFCIASTYFLRNVGRFTSLCGVRSRWLNADTRGSANMQRISEEIQHESFRPCAEEVGKGPHSNSGPRRILDRYFGQHSSNAEQRASTRRVRALMWFVAFVHKDDVFGRGERAHRDPQRMEGGA